MRYQGSKLKLKNVLSNIVSKNLTDNMTYVEPFAGGFNSFAYIDAKNKIANDNNHYTIALWTAIKDGTFSEKEKNFCRNLTKEQYYDVKNSYLKKDGRYSDAVIGYVGFSCSYGGGWFNGYANFNPNKNENHIIEAYNGFMKQIENFKNIIASELTNVSYEKMNIPNNSLIYCDPPYAGTKQYKDYFDHNKFWQWCREQVKKGNKIIISEYNAPSDFICIWSKNMQDGMSGDSSKRKIEKIFMHKSQKKLFKL